MLDEQLKQQTLEFLKLLESPIQFTLSVGEDENSKKVEQFVKEICSLDEKNLSYTYEKLEFTPAFRIDKKGEQPSGVTFAGVPLGHEYNSFILALLQVAGRAPKIEESQKKQIQALKGPLHFVTYVSLTCHNCPDVVQALNILAILNPSITHTMVDGGMYKEEVEAKDIMAVPATFLDGELWSSGKISLDEILQKLGSDDTEKFAPFTKEVYDMAIIGAGPAGASAAIYASRKGIKTAIISDQMGGQVNETLGIENVIGTPYIEGPQLAQRLKTHMDEYDIDYIQGQKVASIEKDTPFKITLNNGVVIQAKTIVLATGARWRDLNVPGEQEFRTKGVAYCPHCDAPLFAGKKVAVAGGGNSGIEAAIDLANIASHVTVFEFMDRLKADQVLQKRAKELPNIDILTNVALKEIKGKEKVEQVAYEDRLTGEVKDMDLDGIFIQIGLVPNTDFLGDTVDRTPRGEIIIDEVGHTNVPGIFAAGDCTTQTYKQIIISMGSGATAALSAFDYLIREQ